MNVNTIMLRLVLQIQFLIVSGTNCASGAKFKWKNMINKTIKNQNILCLQKLIVLSGGLGVYSGA
jgi:hypothetical protein